MTFTHKPGIDSGIDYGVVAAYLLWIVAIIVVLVLFAIRGHAQELRGGASDDMFIRCVCRI
jgi:hypothetical protein